MLGTTNTGAAATASTFMSEEDMTKLWHVRLGHKSKKRLTLLSKRDLLCGQSTGKVELCEHCTLRK